MFCTLIQLSGLSLAWGDVDASGTWESTYDFGPVQEIMTANIQQVETNLVGSFSVEVRPSGEEYSGIIFGTVEGNSIKAYYLSVRDLGGDDPVVSVSFADGKLVDDDTIQGLVYYEDSDLVEMPGFEYEATRV